MNRKNYKIAVSIILCLMIVISAFPGALFDVSAAVVASGNCGESGSNVKWSLDDAGTITLSGSGRMADYYDEENDAVISPWYSKKDSVKKAVFASTITYIGVSSFSDCTSMTSVTLPTRSV